MQLNTIAQLVALMGVASAAPKPLDTPLKYDDVILLSADGNHQLIKHSEYQVLADRGLLDAAPAFNQGGVKGRSAMSSEKRCEESEEIQITSDTKFLNWDVPMSPVLSSAGGGVTVGVTSGYSISNSVTATVGITATIQEILGLSMSVSYAESWTTSESSTISYTLPDNNYGLIVSQPMVRRVEGNYLSGCTDSPTSEGYVSNTYTSQSYGNLEWVSGIIRLCNSTTYPVPYCIGTGTHS